MSEHLTLEDLKRWEDHGAGWRAVEIGPERVTVELCTCFGEPVELAQGDDAELIGYVTDRRRSEP